MISEKIERVHELLMDKIVIVAFSGGVDSTVMASLAKDVAKKVVLVTLVSDSLPPGELDVIKRVAGELNLELQLVNGSELENENYVRNGPDRCYQCKSTLIEALNSVKQLYPTAIIVNGTNYTDVISGDYRPGYKAFLEHGVLSPLVEARLTKEEIREIARIRGISVADKPSMPCLASRFAYGTRITREGLQMVANAEKFIRERFSVKVVRVRNHDGLARIEVGREERYKILNPEALDIMGEYLKRLGFKFVTVDCFGYQTGSLNTVIPEEVKEHAKEERRVFLPVLIN